MKRFLALARVSSREQEREGFSLDVQEESLRRYAAQHHGEIVKLFRIAETASKSEARNTFRELLAYAKKNAAELDEILFYKLDRAARNLFDYADLKRLKRDFDLPFTAITQQTPNTPAGDLSELLMFGVAAYTTAQQSQDVREGLARRVREGWFVGRAPYGYKNVRKDGRGIVEIHPVEGPKVERIFRLFAFENLTLDALVDRLARDGVTYRDSVPRFVRSSLHAILRDRSYIGEVEHHGQWYPGKHTPLIDRPTWDRVQALLGGSSYRSHEMTYANKLMTCAKCGHPITGERKFKKTSRGEKAYTYYRCVYYTKHEPQIRVTEAELDRQVLAILQTLRIEDDALRDWFRAVLAAQTRDAQKDSLAQRNELERQASLLVQQQDRLLNMRLADEIAEETFANKQTQIRDRLARIKLQLDVLDRSHDEMSDLASKVFELSQVLCEKWLTADYATKRRILEILFLNCRLDGATLCPEMRKPFDALAEGLISKNSRGDRRSFEPIRDAFVDAILLQDAEVMAATRLMAISA